MTEAQRIDYLISVLENGVGSEFAKRIGVSHAAVSKMRNGIFGISKKIDAIIKAYPSVNRDWLDTGEGYPGDLTIDLVKAHYERKLKRNEQVIDQLLKKLKEYESLQNACKED
jgi:transcriptional regulator with XRE-family HTH domain